MNKSVRSALRLPPPADSRHFSAGGAFKVRAGRTCTACRIVQHTAECCKIVQIDLRKHARSDHSASETLCVGNANFSGDLARHQ